MSTQIVFWFVIIMMTSSFIALGYQLIQETVENNKVAAENKAAREKEKKNNELIKSYCKKIYYKDNSGYTIIYAEYAFGRWYVHYEYCGKGHFSVTRSFYDGNGQPREDYARVNTKYGFHNEAAKDVFLKMELIVAALAGNTNALKAWEDSQDQY